MSYNSYTSEFKYEVIMAYKNEDYTLSELSSKYHVHEMTILRWNELFELKGISGLQVSTTWKKYSKELKEAAVLDYLSGNYSYKDILRKYSISSDSILSRWIKKYNSHSRLKDTGKGRSNSMTNKRKTTLNERIKIVEETLENEKNYQYIAEKHQVSYQQVYQWVRKYEVGGWDALQDRRGRSKPEEELTSEEKTKLTIRQMKKENERLRAENAFLKKLAEIERGEK